MPKFFKSSNLTAPHRHSRHELLRVRMHRPLQHLRREAGFDHLALMHHQWSLQKAENKARQAVETRSLGIRLWCGECLIHLPVAFDFVTLKVDRGRRNGGVAQIVAHRRLR
jgi:hypothetical protein